MAESAEKKGIFSRMIDWGKERVSSAIGSVRSSVHSAVSGVMPTGYYGKKAVLESAFDTAIIQPGYRALNILASWYNPLRVAGHLVRGARDFAQGALRTYAVARMSTYAAMSHGIDVVAHAFAAPTTYSLHSQAMSVMPPAYPVYPMKGGNLGWNGIPDLPQRDADTRSTAMPSSEPFFGPGSGWHTEARANNNKHFTMAA